MTVPVKYMIVGCEYPNEYDIVNTDVSGFGAVIPVVATCYNRQDAEAVCYALNTAEGYEYPKP